MFAILALVLRPNDNSQDDFLQLFRHHCITIITIMGILFMPLGKRTWNADGGTGSPRLCMPPIRMVPTGVINLLLLVFCGESAQSLY
jgi:hypothetical protein